MIEDLNTIEPPEGAPTGADIEQRHRCNAT